MGVILDSSEIVAAPAISMDYIVCTANRRNFDKIKGLRLEVRPA